MVTHVDKHDGVYAAQRDVTELDDCTFYHTMDLPGHGVVEGPWDLRGGVDQYLGEVEFAGRRVLELGTADGYLTFHIERQGAEVVSYDLPDATGLDLVPFARLSDDQVAETRAGFAAMMARVQNAYWFAHRAFGSRARLVQGDIYSVPPAIGPVDVSVFGSLLLHTHNPFGALQPALRLTRRTVVVTDGLGVVRLPPLLRRVGNVLPRQLRRPAMRFMPDWRTSVGAEGWWRLSPEIVSEFLGVLGFERSEVTTHFQRFNGRRRHLFTVVAHRTAPFDG